MSERIQRCTIGGFLNGIICPDLGVYDLISGAEIFAVRSSQKEPTPNPTGEERGEAKRVLRTVSIDEVKRVAAGQGLIEGTTDERGFFCLFDRSYQGELLDIYVCLNAVPGPGKKILRLNDPTCLFIGTYQPHRLRDGWSLTLYIPQSIWCALKKLVDAWTVAGRVADCDTDQPLGNVTVTARDVDKTDDDLLGSAVTNSLGIYRIDYPGDAFRRGTIIDIELFGGPDIYFDVKDSGGNPLLTEDRWAGRAVGRCDSGPCKCINLCIDLPDPGDDTGPGDLPSAWTNVGSAFLIPDSPSALNDFDAEGYASASKFVLSGTPAMQGGVPRFTVGGDPIEYRFKVGNTTALNSAAPLDESLFTRIVGAGPLTDQSLFATTHLGYVQRTVSTSPLVTETVQITAVQSDLSAGGWLNVSQVIENRFVELGRDPSTIALFSWIPNGNLMLVNTGALPTAANVPDGAAGPGQAVASGTIPVQKMSLRFETRNANTTAHLPGWGKTLNSMVVNNNPVFLKVAIKEHLDSGDFCGIIHVNKPHIAYTVYHPHLGSADLHVWSNNLTYDHHLNDPEPPSGTQRLPLSGNLTPTPSSINRPDLNLPGTLHKCTYTVWLTASSRLHNGESPVGGAGPVSTTFFFDPAP